MTFKLLNRVRMTVSGTPGTGTITVGAAVVGFQSFTLAGASDGDTTPYLIEDGTAWEIGQGTWHASGGTYSRDNVTQVSGGGSSPISASANAILTVAARAVDFAGSSTLAGDTDVSISGPSNGQLLIYNATLGKWQNTTSSLAAPSIVQSKAFCQDDAPFVMSAAPAAGNLLVATMSHWATNAALGAGWANVSNITSTGDFSTIAIRVAQSTDTASLSPYTGCVGADVVIWELSGAALSAPLSFLSFQYQTSTTETIGVYALAGSIVLGAFTQTGSNTLPTSLTGPNPGPTAQASSGSGSGYPRSVAGFYEVVNTAAQITATATYASVGHVSGTIISINGALEV